MTGEAEAVAAGGGEAVGAGVTVVFDEVSDSRFEHADPAKIRAANASDCQQKFVLIVQMQLPCTASLRRLRAPPKCIKFLNNAPTNAPNASCSGLKINLLKVTSAVGRTFKFCPFRSADVGRNHATRKPDCLRSRLITQSAAQTPVRHELKEDTGETPRRSSAFDRRYMNGFHSILEFAEKTSDTSRSARGGRERTETESKRTMKPLKILCTVRSCRMLPDISFQFEQH